MSDQEKRNPSGEIDWSLYDRQARSILEGDTSQPSVWPQETSSDQDEDSFQGQAPASDPEPTQPDFFGNFDEFYEEDESDGEAYEQADWQEPFDASQGQPHEEEAYTRRREPLPPPEDPPAPPVTKKRRRVRSAQVTFLVAVLYVVSVLSIAFIGATLGWRFACDVLALNKEELTCTIQVQAGESISDVAQDLYENGLIDYPFLFEVFAAFTDKGANISSGSYDLNTTMDYSALLSNMSASSSQRSTVTVTIPEGYTVEEIFQLLEQLGVCTQEELEESALNDEYDYSFLSGLDKDDNPYWMEGYLFPDTYEFYMDSDPKVAISKMLYNYSTKFTDEMKTRAERLGYSQHEIMIIASIIEKETDGRDQADIASVIYNRLQLDNTETQGKLQMDSTIQYILEERKESLTEEDLQIDSPYNTYLYEGLPAGTICNPGMEAIEAALYPNSTTYYYFILGTDGTTHFFSSYSDFINYRNGIEVEQAEEADATEDTE